MHHSTIYSGFAAELPLASHEDPDVLNVQPSIHEEVLQFEKIRRGSAITSSTFTNFGTLGCFVRDDKCQLYVVTCAHVVMNEEEKLLTGCLKQKRNIPLWSKRISSDGQLKETELTKPMSEAYIIHGDYDFKKDAAMSSSKEEYCFIDIAVIPIHDDINPNCYLPVFAHDNCKCVLSFEPKQNLKVEKTGAATGTTKHGEIESLQFMKPENSSGKSCFVNKGVKIRDTAEGQVFGDRGDSGSIVLQPQPLQCGPTPAAGLYWAKAALPNQPSKFHLVMSMQLAFAAVKHAFGLHLTVCGNAEDFEQNLKQFASGPRNNIACAVSQSFLTTSHG